MYPLGDLSAPPCDSIPNLDCTFHMEKRIFAGPFPPGYQKDFIVKRRRLVGVWERSLQLKGMDLGRKVLGCREESNARVEGARCEGPG